MNRAKKQHFFIAWFNKQPITLKAVYITFGLGLISGLILLILDKSFTSKPEVILLATPMITPSQKSNYDYRVGIIPGHKDNDVGEVCADGLSEKEVNRNIANNVKDLLIKDGYSAQIFADFNQRLIDYQALTIIVIHSDSCEYTNDSASGFKLSPASRYTDEAINQKTEQLIKCLEMEYKATTSLNYLKDVETMDMVFYNSFEQASKLTPIVIVDAGFLNLDRNLLSSRSDLVAEGLSNGLRCFFRLEKVALLDTTVTLVYPGDIQNEYIQVQNLSSEPLSLIGWTLQDEYGNTLTFPMVTVNSDSSIRVYTQKKGINSNTELFWEITDMRWQSNDRIVLNDSSGTFRNAERVP